MNKLRVTDNVPAQAREAWEKAIGEGGSPAAALRAAKDANHSNRLTYLPHQGKREIARRAKRLARSAQA